MLMSEIKERKEVDEKGHIIRCGQCDKINPKSSFGDFVRCKRLHKLQHKNSFCQIGEGE